MVVPFLMTGVLMALALGAHLFVGTRETLSLHPTERSAAADTEHDAATRAELNRHWAQAMCAFQLVSIDLFVVTFAAFLLGFTDVLPAKREIGLFLAAYLGAWGVVWLVQLAAVKAKLRTYYILEQWMLFFLCAALMMWGALTL